MKKQSFLIVALLSVAVAAYTQVNIQQITAQDMMQERAVFTKSWTATYQDCSLDQLGVSDLPFFLDDLFDQEEAIYQEQREQSIFYKALCGDTVVGYVSYDMVEPGVAYVRQWALLPSHCTVDTFRELIFALVERDESITTLKLDVRMLATDYRQRFEEFGFEESDVHGSLDANYYMGYALIFGDKCGTCLCDYTDAEFDEDPMFDVSFGIDQAQVTVCPEQEDMCSYS